MIVCVYFFYLKILAQSVYDCRSYLHKYSVSSFTVFSKNLLVIGMGAGAPFPGVKLPRPEADYWPP